MTIFELSKNLFFPPTKQASQEGIIAFGGDLSLDRLVLAYSSGIFPWPHEGYPLLWFCPDPRFCLKPEEIIINKSLQKALKKNPYRLSFDTDFEKVIEHCAKNKRPDQSGTWITDEIISAYVNLHRNGFAHSVEAYENNTLVGGIYGISLGGIFFGESMFALSPNASKIAFASLAAHLVLWNFDLIDCQAYTEHLSRFGASEYKREKFMQILKRSLKTKPTLKAPWQLTLNAADCLKILCLAKHE
ncbi:MAG: leucyl/phenylalanyl-tRNA--protein transferase [bacterium]|nr:leucyl/phenylalanyl-tRNA--protein transferase [bacterium]